MKHEAIYHSNAPLIIQLEDAETLFVDAGTSVIPAHRHGAPLPLRAILARQSPPDRDRYKRPSDYIANC